MHLLFARQFTNFLLYLPFNRLCVCLLLVADTKDDVAVVNPANDQFHRIGGTVTLLHSIRSRLEDSRNRGVATIR
jgi:hypothetical protein